MASPDSAFQRRHGSPGSRSGPSAESPEIRVGGKSLADRTPATPESVAAATQQSAVSTMRKYRSQTLKDYQIMIEYKHLKHHAPRGMYVLPSFTDRRKWHGVVFLRQGLYKRGIFKFIVEMPESYPEDGARPTVRFLNHVFHPMVDPETGVLDLETKFPEWKTGEHYIVLVLNWVKKIFYLKDFSCPNPLNEEALRLIKADRNGFLRKLDDCVNLSIRERYDRADDSPIIFTPYKKQHDVIRSRILRLDKQAAKGGSGGGGGGSSGSSGSGGGEKGGAPPTKKQGDGQEEGKSEAGTAGGGGGGGGGGAAGGGVLAAAAASGKA